MFLDSVIGKPIYKIWTVLQYVSFKSYRVILVGDYWFFLLQAVYTCHSIIMFLVPLSANGVLKIMKSDFTAIRLLLVTSLLAMASITQAETLKLVADDWPPFTSDKQGQRIAANLVEHALNTSGIKTRTQILDWQQVLKGLKGDAYDAVVGAWKNSEREQYLMFSRPYLENRIQLVGRTDNRIEFTGLAQLVGKKVGVVKGYAYGDDISGKNGMIRVASDSVAENLEKLLRKEIDYLLADSIVAHGMENHLPLNIKKQLVIYKRVVTRQGLHFAVRKTYPGAKKLLEKFNKTIGSMIVDGTYNRILGVDWVVADTNNDGINEYIVGNRVSDRASDPATSSNNYPLFESEHELSRQSRVKYRVLNQEYDSWNEAQRAINEEKQNRLSPNDNTSGTFDFLLKRF